jgi:hypothetical protein
MVGASEADDPLRALLDADIGDGLQDVWHSKRLGVDFTIRGFANDKDYEKVVDRATTWTRRRGGNKQRELDNRKLSKLLVAEGLVSPDLSQGSNDFKQLAEKYGVMDAESLVGKMFLPGEVDQIAEKVLILSGYDDDLETIAGN